MAASASNAGKYNDPPPPYTPYAQASHSAPTNHGYGTIGSTTVIVTEPQRVDTVILVGGCPVCRVGVLEEEFTWLGILCCLLFFPLGMICCLLMRQRRCQNCGAVF